PPFLRRRQGLADRSDDRPAAADGMRVPRNHALLVGRNHPGREARTGVRNARSVPRVGSRIELEPEPGQPLADQAPDERGVLADAARKDKTVDAAHGRCERRSLALDAIDEIVDRNPGKRRLGGEQVAHVVADAGEALQTALLVKEPFEPRYIPPLRS